MHARRFHMHREKISCLTEIMHRKKILYLANSCITGRYSCPVRNHALPEKESCIQTEILIRWHQQHSFILIKVNNTKSTSTSREASSLHHLPFMVTSTRRVHWHQKKYHNRISIYLFRHHVMSTFEITLQKTKHKLYLLFVRPIELTSHVARTIECRHGKRNCLPS